MEKTNSFKILKIILCIVFAVSVFAGVSSKTELISNAATSGSCGSDLTWKLDTSKGVLEISGNGSMNDYTSTKRAPWYSNRKYIKTVKISGNVTSIGNFAFNSCTNLRSITISEGIKSIGKFAFFGCSSIDNVSLPDSLTFIDSWAFACCYNMNDITLGKNVRSMGESVFRKCYELKSIVIPDSVTDIGEYVFSACTALTEITLPDKVTSAENYLFEGCSSIKTVKLGKSVTRIGVSAFTGCLSMTEITIPGHVTVIDDYAFSGCSSLKDLTIPTTAKRIGKNAFLYCRNLGSIVIPDSVTDIGENAFKECFGVTTLKIGDGITRISDNMFFDLHGLTSLTIGKSVESISDNAFPDLTELETIVVSSHNKSYSSSGNCLIEKSSGTLIMGCSNSIIPNSVRSIGKKAFYNCFKLKSIEIPEGVVSIGDNAFSGCVGIVSITLPKSVTSIGNGAFYNCYKLVQVINKSSLDIVKGNSSYGHVGYYALDVHSSDSKIDDLNGYLFCTYDNVVYLLGYSGNDSRLVLPDNYKNGSYSIYKYAFYDRSEISSILIPECVSDIGARAFGCWTDSQKIYFSANEPSGLWGVNWDKECDAQMLFGHIYEYEYFFCKECNSEEPSLKSELNFESASVVFEDSLGIKFYILKSALKGYNSFYTQLLMNGIEYKLEGKENGDYYQFEFNKINAKEMSDVFSVKLYAKRIASDKEKTFYGEDKSYSLREYAMNRLAESSDLKFKKLLVSVLLYGASSQIYFGYNTDDLASAELTKEQLALVADTILPSVSDYSYINKENKAVGLSGASLLFEGTLNMNILVSTSKYEGNINDLTLKIKYKSAVTGKTVTQSVLLSTFTKNENFYTYKLDGLGVREMASVIEFTVYDAEGKDVSGTLNYSMSTYVYNKVALKSDVAELARATFCYANAAIEYFKSVNTK